MAWQGYQFGAYCWPLITVSLAVVLIRIYVDYKRIRKVSPYREVIVFLAWLIFLAVVVTNMYLIANNFFNGSDASWNSLSLNMQVVVSKIAFAQDFLVLPCIYLCKVDLILLFHDLSPRRHNTKMFWGIIAAWVSTAVGFLVQILYLLFACNPISLQWQADTAPCVNTIPYYYSVWCTHIASDLVVYLVPLAIIYQQQKMTLSEKLSAGAMFFMGFINIMTSVACMVGLSLYGREPYAMYGAAVFLAMAQLATAIWIVCMPQLRSFYRLVKEKAGKKESKEVASSTGESEITPVASPTSTVTPARKVFKVFRITTRAENPEVTTPAREGTAFERSSDLERGV